MDATPEMVDAGRRRLGESASVAVGDLDDYVPPHPVAATTVFRAISYARTEEVLRARAFTDRKLVFDLNPGQIRSTTWSPTSTSP